MSHDTAAKVQKPATKKKVARAGGAGARSGRAPVGAIGAALGVDLRNRATFIEAIEAGFELPAVRRLADLLDLGDEALAEAAGMSVRTLERRRREGRLHADESDRLSRLAMLLEQATRLFEGDVGRAAHWLRSAKRALGGATPLDYAATEPGAQEVRELLARLEHGVFS